MLQPPPDEEADRGSSDCGTTAPPSTSDGDPAPTEDDGAASPSVDDTEAERAAKAVDEDNSHSLSAPSQDTDEQTTNVPSTQEEEDQQQDLVTDNSVVYDTLDDASSSAPQEDITDDTVKEDDETIINTDDNECLQTSSNDLQIDGDICRDSPSTVAELRERQDETLVEQCEHDESGLTAGSAPMDANCTAENNVGATVTSEQDESITKNCYDASLSLIENDCTVTTEGNELCSSNELSQNMHQSECDREGDITDDSLRQGEVSLLTEECNSQMSSQQNSSLQVDSSQTSSGIVESDNEADVNNSIGRGESGISTDPCLDVDHSREIDVSIATTALSHENLEMECPEEEELTEGPVSNLGDFNNVHEVTAPSKLEASNSQDTCVNGSVPLYSSVDAGMEQENHLESSSISEVPDNIETNTEMEVSARGEPSELVHDAIADSFAEPASQLSNVISERESLINNSQDCNSDSPANFHHEDYFDEDEEEDEEGEESFESTTFRNMNINDNSELQLGDSNSPKKNLPRCKMTRTYVCEHCNLTTQNPRDHLYHIRDFHGEAISIYECDTCQYASKNFTKLMRHLQMVHKKYLNGEVDVNGVRRKVKQSKFRAPPSTNPLALSGTSSPKKPKPEKTPKVVEYYESIMEPVTDEKEEEDDEASVPSPPSVKKDSSERETQMLQCEQCNFTCKSRKRMTKHEVSYHLKKTFYRCSKCNYVTHLKGRYAKHMKYHELPIVKCDYCDFRTPYRWNLDRHLKNHTEDSGEYKCHLCNFSAAIKQSLTVHVANHHLTPEQIKERELKRTIGISDPQDYAIDDEELELMKMERDEDPEAFQLADLASQSFTVSNIDVGGHDENSTTVDGVNDCTDGESKKKKPKIKLTIKKMKSPRDNGSAEASERHNFEDDFIHPDDLVHRNGNVYIKNIKCDYCSFKAAFKSELERHLRRHHNSESEVVKKNKKVVRSASSDNVSIHSDSDARDESSVDGCDSKINETAINSSTRELPDESHTQTGKPNTDTRDKKRSSFIEDLQDKLSNTNAQNLVCQYCGHNSKCLSESVRHQKLHLSAKNVSTATSILHRCQFCKQNCKTTKELVHHLKICPEVRKNQISDCGTTRRAANKANTSDHLESDEDSKDSATLEVDMSRSASCSDTESSTREATQKQDACEIHEDSNEEEGNDNPAEALVDNSVVGEKKGYNKRVYRCPQCKFWSTTASRFHVHIVGHFNKKPYVCSECGYRSNWRWDITKHIKIRVNRDRTHKTAEVFIKSDSGEKNYEEYEKYVTVIQVDGVTPDSENSIKKTRLKRNVDATSSETTKESSSNEEASEQQNKSAKLDAAAAVQTCKLEPICEINTPPFEATPPPASQQPRNTSQSSAIPPMVRIPLDGNLLAGTSDVLDIKQDGSTAHKNSSLPNKPEPSDVSRLNITSSVSALTGPVTNAPILSAAMAAPGTAIRNPTLAKVPSALAQQLNKSFKIPQPKISSKPPPLLALKGLARFPTSTSSSTVELNSSGMITSRSSIISSGGGGGGHSTAAYQIITPQVSLSQGTALQTSLETLQLLAAGTTNVRSLQGLASSISSAPSSSATASSSLVSSLSLPSSLSITPAGGVARASVTTTTASTPVFPDPATVAQQLKGLVADAAAKAGSGGAGGLNSAATTLQDVLKGAGVSPAVLQSIAAAASAASADPNNTNSQSKLALQQLQKQQQQQQQQHHQQQSVAGVSASTQSTIKDSSSSTPSTPTSAGATESTAPCFVLDHQGNPEWKCSLCNFRDTERSTVEQHHSLVHGSSSTVVSLLHAVHRCDVCAFAAGTKRHVQLHIDSAHGGKGGITSSCEGQNPNIHSGAASHSGGVTGSAAMGVNKLLSCRECPFKCQKKSVLKQHQLHHTHRPEFIFKCMACNYFVSTKMELLEHLTVHGLQIPASLKGTLAAPPQTSVAQAPPPPPPPPPPQQQSLSDASGDGAALLTCDSCPFEARSRTKLLQHRQFHRPRDLAFKCPQCSYNVTRRHLLAQHIKVHNLPPETMERLYGSNGMSSDTRERSASPSPSLTITPINGSAGSTSLLSLPGIRNEQINAPQDIIPNEEYLPLLTDDVTIGLPDVPMVWATKNGKFMKMFKCRFCPHVNMRKTNVQDHEKMHQSRDSLNSQLMGSIKCPHCSYVSLNVGVISAHIKIHEGAMGKIHALVDQSKTDEEQIQFLASQAAMKKLLFRVTEAGKEQALKRAKALKTEKMIFCCQFCPARFLIQKEIMIHSKFHGLNLTHTCDKCNYSVRQEPLLLIHAKVHSTDYQENTITLLTQFTHSPEYPPIPGMTVTKKAEENSADLSSTSTTREADKPKDFTVTKGSSGETRFKCSLCPSTFSKQLTLQYHQSLHGANNPHKCQRCTYAAKTEDALTQHVALHNKSDKESINEAVKIGVVFSEPSSVSAANSTQPPIKLKFVGLKSQTVVSSAPVQVVNSIDNSTKQFRYYVDEQIPLSGVDLLRHKTQMEQQQQQEGTAKNDVSTANLEKSAPKTYSRPCKNEEDEAKRIGNPSLNYPMHIDKVTGKTREKRYKCKICPSAFEKVDQYDVHANLHGANLKYKCKICDYAVKFYANFNMHIKRHKYSERVDSKKNGTALVDDSDPRYDPIVQGSEENGVSSRESSSRETSIMADSQDLTTAERQHILLQNKKGIDKNKEEEGKDKRVFYCQYCPYANVRRDAVDSHSMRHLANGSKGLYRCNYCDYVASQPNFLKDHTKVHFKPFKHVIPEGYIRHDQEEIFSTELVTESQPEPKEHDKISIFSHNSGKFLPYYKFHIDTDDKENKIDDAYAIEQAKLIDPIEESGIVVDFVSSEVIQAPNAYILTLKPSKSKGKEGHILQDPDFLFDSKQQSDGEVEIPGTTESNTNNNNNNVPELRTSKRRRSSKGSSSPSRATDDGSDGSDGKTRGSKRAKNTATSDQSNDNSGSDSNCASVVTTNGVTHDEAQSADSFLGFEETTALTNKQLAPAKQSTELP